MDVGHLSAIADPLERALQREEDVWFAGSASVQHGKSAMIQFALGRAIARDPTLRLGYGTYVSDFARDRSKQIRDVAVKLGCKLRDDVQAGQLWRTTAGGFVQGVGVDGVVGGKSYDVFVLDDPYKNRQDAESESHRERVEAMVRLICQRSHSVFLIHARWHVEDAVGKCEGDPEWVHVNLPAVAEAGLKDSNQRAPGEVLWKDHPVKGDASYFDPFRKNELDWSSNFQGRPQRRGGKVFERAPSFYAKLPEKALIFGVGYDLAGSKNKQADHSIIVVLALDPESGIFYLVKLWRGQVSATELRKRVEETCRAYSGAPRFSWVGGQERSIVDLLNEPGFDGTPGAQLTAKTASGQGDKWVRSQPVATTWNDGRVLLPLNPDQQTREHMPEFVRVVQKFTGVNDSEDDDVDALAAGHHVLKAYERRESLFQGVPKLRVWRR